MLAKITPDLREEPPVITILKGEMSQAVEETIRCLRNDENTFGFGDAIATVSLERICILDRDSLAHHLGQRIQFTKEDRRANNPVRTDPPDDLVRRIIALGARCRLKQLLGVLDHPSLRLDGSLLCRQGYDAETKLFLTKDFEVLDHPTRADAEAAIETLIKPFEDFPFVDVRAIGALLCAILTAVVRPVLPTAPAFAFDAPSQGSGKTLLASCVGALREGRVPTIWPHTKGRDDEEIRKRLMAALSSGATNLIWDNIIGVFDSASMAALITSQSMTDRILGKSLAQTVPNRAIILLTGNNMSLSGDMPRRVVTCRIDPLMEKPYTRSFDLDPLKYVLEHREKLTQAACTLIRAQMLSGFVHTSKKVAGFEDWDRLVRQTVVSLERFGDPIDIIEENHGSDTQTEALAGALQELSNTFHDRHFSSRDVFQLLPSNSQLNEALSDIAGEIRSARSLGTILRNREGRIASGLRLHGKRDSRTNSRKFKIESVGGTTGTTGTISQPHGKLSPPPSMPGA